MTRNERDTNDFPGSSPAAEVITAVRTLGILVAHPARCSEDLFASVALTEVGRLVDVDEGIARHRHPPLATLAALESFGRYLERRRSNGTMESI